MTVQHWCSQGGGGRLNPSSPEILLHVYAYTHTCKRMHEHALKKFNPTAPSNPEKIFLATLLLYRVNLPSALP